ncbi:MFS transporter [Mechercharimyces sp. CAU 1602]|uniref:MFS transporter n=1 Tax=Mechercharimyces sp. CAU 1602 TaxID=2973933 RepID=UPI0021638CFB|nr:MFS transporter [Mechercharimyces sp. CAU 1602]MCS1352352.1 MFS transporter [Mechercharimyces sp. CAU 1602]
MKSLLKSSLFVFLLSGQALSGLGGTFSTFIQSWLLYELTGSKIAMGSLWLYFMLPGIIIQIFSGPYLDRWDLRKVMIACQWIRAGAFLVPATMLYMGELHSIHLYMAAIVSGMMEPLFRPASMSYVSRVVAKEQLVKANSLLEGVTNFTMWFGPVVAGWAIMEVGASSLLWVLVLLLFLSGLVLGRLPVEKKEEASTGVASWVKEVREGTLFFCQYPAFLWMGLLMMWVNFCAGAFLPMIVPYVTEFLGGGPVEVGIYSVGFPLGFALGALILGLQKGSGRLRDAMIVSLLLQAVLMACLGWVRFFPLAFMIEVCVGLTAAQFVIRNTTLYQQYVPAHLRGRVFTLRMLLSRLGFPVGAVLGGVMGELVGIPALFTTIGTSLAFAGVIVWISPMYRQLDKFEEVGLLEH